MKSKYTRTIVIFILLIVLHSLPSIAFSEPVQELHEKYHAKKVYKLTFNTDLNLDYDDLISSVYVAPGEIIKSGDIAMSIERLKDREIFKEVSVSISENKRGLHLTFNLEPKLTISKVQFKGNKILDDRKLKRYVSSLIGLTSDTELIQKAKEKIIAKYAKEGNFFTTIEISESKSKTSPQIKLIFRINEGKRTAISDVFFNGSFKPDAIEINEIIRSQAIGESVSDETLKEIKRAYLIRLRKEGYLGASVKLEHIKYSKDKLEGFIFFCCRAWKTIKHIF